MTEPTTLPSGEPPNEAEAQLENDEVQVNIHKPKPLHKLSEVLGEIGIIVVGILIAIGLEQLVEQVRWSHEVTKARGTLHAEAAESNAIFRYRIEANSCVQRRLASLQDVTEDVAAGKAVPSVGPIVSNIDFALVDSAWQAQRASQVLTHFDDEELQRLGTYYFQLGTAQKLIGEEATSWRIIAVLEGNPKRLSAVDLANVRIAIKTARSINDLIQYLAEEELESARTLRLPTAPIAKERLAAACNPIDFGQVHADERSVR